MCPKPYIFALLCIIVDYSSGQYYRQKFTSGRNGYRGYFTSDPVKYAHCDVEPSPGYSVRGSVDFRQRFGHLLEVNVEIEGFDITDEGVHHGFHVHEYGDLSAGCGSTGGHFNPHGANHGAPENVNRHVGDFGNLIEDAAGNNKTHFCDRRSSLYSAFRNIIGRAIVVHAGQDDLGKGGDAGSLANGNAGARVACCVIGLVDGSRWDTIDESRVII